MDKRNESIYNQINSLISKIKEYDSTFVTNPIEFTDDTASATFTDTQQILFKKLSDENKNLKSISTKIIKLNELLTKFDQVRTKVEGYDINIDLNANKSVSTLDISIQQLELFIGNLNDLIKQQNAKKEEERVDDEKEEPKISYSTITNMEDIKRAFFSKEYTEFRNLINGHKFMYYRADYKYSSDNDGKPEYIAKNLVGGFIRNMEDYSKYFLTCFRCYANNGNYTYPSMWIVNLENNETMCKILGSLYDDFIFTPVEELDINTFLAGLEKKSENEHNMLIEKYLH